MLTITLPAPARDPRYVAEVLDEIELVRSLLDVYERRLKDQAAGRCAETVSSPIPPGVVAKVPVPAARPATRPTDRPATRPTLLVPAEAPARPIPAPAPVRPVPARVEAPAPTPVVEEKGGDESEAPKKRKRGRPRKQECTVVLPQFSVPVGKSKPSPSSADSEQSSASELASTPNHNSAVQSVPSRAERNPDRSSEQSSILKRTSNPPHESIDSEQSSVPWFTSNPSSNSTDSEQSSEQSSALETLSKPSLNSAKSKEEQNELALRYLPMPISKSPGTDQYYITDVFSCLSPSCGAVPLVVRVPNEDATRVSVTCKCLECDTPSRYTDVDREQVAQIKTGVKIRAFDYTLLPIIDRARTPLFNEEENNAVAVSEQSATLKQDNAAGRIEKPTITKQNNAAGRIEKPTVAKQDNATPVEQSVIREQQNQTVASDEQAEDIKPKAKRKKRTLTVTIGEPSKQAPLPVKQNPPKNLVLEVPVIEAPPLTAPKVKIKPFVQAPVKAPELAKDALVEFSDYSESEDDIAALISDIVGQQPPPDVLQQTFVEEVQSQLQTYDNARLIVEWEKGTGGKFQGEAASIDREAFIKAITASLIEPPKL